jgi:hypothetical protein
MCKSRYVRPMRVFAIVLVAGLLAACGGKSHLTVGDCLNHAGFLVTSSGAKVEGTTPAGIGFTLTVYPSVAAAKHVASRLDARTTAVVGTGVVDSRGNPGSGARVSAADLAVIGRCLTAGSS